MKYYLIKDYSKKTHKYLYTKCKVCGTVRHINADENWNCQNKECKMFGTILPMSKIKTIHKEKWKQRRWIAQRRIAIKWKKLICLLTGHLWEHLQDGIWHCSKCSNCDYQSSIYCNEGLK